MLDIAQASANQTNSIFNSSEFKYNSFKGVQNWEAVLKKSSSEFKEFLACANNKQKCQTPEQHTWREFTLSIRNLSRNQKIKAVNSYFNKWDYKSDQGIYGTQDYWASLSQFMKNSGDCEDYAIAKYYTLMALGFKDHEMRIVALKDQNAEKGHVVLALYEREDIQILDNLSNSITSHHTLRNYTPLYSVNQTSRWVHKPKVLL
ncbi:transglutaminase-like cysteine peptidase [Kiloniella sp.]|uniref:transglutaminase-like cysteine peptidase n=1 Tax=Kiloniella sp. TaxID=1938587 RepID=UPI003B01566C